MRSSAACWRVTPLSTDQAASYKSAGKGGYHHAQQKLKVVEDLYAGFFNRHDIGVAQRLIVENYKQHNPFVGDGIKPFLDFFSQTFKDNPQYSAKIYRSAVNGDLVYVHVKYQNNPQDRGTASVDIYRVNDQGKSPSIGTSIRMCRKNRPTTIPCSDPQGPLRRPTRPQHFIYLNIKCRRRVE